MHTTIGLEMTRNQEILAAILSTALLGRLRQDPVPSPQQRLMQSLEEAISEKRLQLEDLAPGSPGYLKTLDQVKKWEEARRVNR